MIEPHELSLVGHWVVTPSGLEADAACRRIELLVSERLVQLAQAEDGWRTLYLDPRDGRMWERTYPSGEQHGAGPPALHCVSFEQARAVYGYEA
jgi:hypothetical protein